MSAFIRLKSKNKVDNYYAYKYYFYLILSIAIFAGGIFCWREYSKFVSLFYFVGAIIIFLFKNGYADFSKKSNCTHPNNLEDFMYSINTERKSKVTKILCGLEAEAIIICGVLVIFFGGVFVPFGTLLYTKTYGLESPSFYIIVNNLAPVIIILCILILTLIESKFWSAYRTFEGRVFNESITPEILQKIDNIKFPVEGQKEQFAKKVSEHLSVSSGLNRARLFSVCSDFLETANRSHSKDILDKIINKSKDS